ncbi:MAG: DEAD/DEAH box helicase, partial [Actinomycetota bacterium]|nr:DEAD/DEAH box helicase [Actinomycetota bacterium]
VETPQPSPFASSLQFGYVSAFMYEGDAPLAERRAQALSLDRSLLAEIMGRDELRELIDPTALSELELDLQKLSEAFRIRDADGLHDALRTIGDLTTDDIRARMSDPAATDGFTHVLEDARRIVRTKIAGEDRWIAVEDSARIRDALGAPLPMGVPHAFLEPVDDALGDIVGRYARTHGPFVPEEVARRLGLGVAVIRDALKSLERRGRVVQGEFRPDGTDVEWIDIEVLRRLRRRSLAAFRHEIEPVAPEALSRFALAWHGIGAHGPASSGLEALLSTIEQLQGAPIAASALERQVLPARLPGYSPALLDQLGASGEIVWCGAGAVGSDDGWIALAVADHAGELLPPAQGTDLSEEATAIKAALTANGASFFRQIADAVGSKNDKELLLSLWELVWAGEITNDTLAPLRALVGGGRSVPSGRPRRRGPAFPSRLGPPAGAGRWSLVPARSREATTRTHAVATQLLSRHGIVTRGATSVERIEGGFAGVYAVLKAMEDAGRCRRGYFVEGLGGAQFAQPGAVDRLRALADPGETRTHVLAATDPANVYGAALPWPERDTSHRPGRKVGASVVLVDGELVLYVERGGRSLLSYSDDVEKLQPAADALALAVHDGVLGRLQLEKADGASVMDSPLSEALLSAGFHLSSRGLRLRA